MKRITLVIAVAVSALLGGTLAAVAATSRPLAWAGGWPVTGQSLVPVPGQARLPAS